MTIGPATATKEKLMKCDHYGVDILRFNFSHYNIENARKVVTLVREVEQELGKKFELLLDTTGPEIRTGKLETPLEFDEGDVFNIYINEADRDPKWLYCDYPGLLDDIYVGGTIMLDSGLLEVEILEKTATYVVVKALQHHFISSKRHVNLPGVKCHLPSLTQDDKDAIIFSIESGFHYVALSFTRTAEEVRAAKAFIKQHWGENMKIVVKIENQEWLDNLEAIVDETDMVMVARGDLGTEIGPEKLPAVQIHMVNLCHQKHTPVIVATQMLESMVDNPIPTRAEATDIFYAVVQGADYVMLSGETAAGMYPIECIKVMNKVIKEAHKYLGN